MVAVAVVSLGAVLAGCEADRLRPGTAATAARAAATAIPTPIRTPTAMVITGLPTRSPSPTPAQGAVSSAQGRGDQLSERALTEVRDALERTISSPALPGLEALLLHEVVLLGEGGGETMQRDLAASWLRRRSGPGLRLTFFERHHHVALLIAQVEGWSPVAPIKRGELGLNFHLYDADGQQDVDG